MERLATAVLYFALFILPAFEFGRSIEKAGGWNKFFKD